jgi:oligoendopeptidase F
MNIRLVLVAIAATGASAVASASIDYHLDLARYYFPSARIEQTDRITLLADVDAFVKQPVSSLKTAAAFARWLARYDSLSKSLNRHDIYVYVRAEEDRHDHTDAEADEVLSDAMTRLDSAVAGRLGGLGVHTLQVYRAADVSLAPYRYFIDSTLARAVHRRQDATRFALLISPALASLTGSYKTLYDRLPSGGGAEAFAARWKPFLDQQEQFASLLIPIVILHSAEARVSGFADAPAAAYFRDDLTVEEVHTALGEVRKSGVYRRYISVLVTAASRRLGIAPETLHAWNLDQADSYQPKLTPFPEAVSLILAAEQPMGAEYASQYKRLFDASQGRVEWCRSGACDRSGFSVGYAGFTSGLFYGAYTGDTNSIRALAHEAGHAVHRELMAENQPLAVYNSGPKFMFESFAIFNEALLLDHLYQTAHECDARAYYLKSFLDDAIFQVWGSAEQTDLEQSIYAAAADGKLHDAADLDALTLQVLGRYMPAPSLDPRMKVYWARDSLYFSDPLYDVNYLFAGLLALEYLHRLEQDPTGLPPRYDALLKNGFTNTPEALEKRFLGVDFEDTERLVRDASALIARRTTILEGLYATCARPGR